MNVIRKTAEIITRGTKILQLIDITVAQGCQHYVGAVKKASLEPVTKAKVFSNKSLIRTFIDIDAWPGLV